MYKDGKIIVGKSDDFVYMIPKMVNRHGLIAGATGTGKTITLKVLAESLSDMGVPVFLADIKGDVSGTCMAGTPSDKLTARLTKMGITDFPFHAYPVRFWDVFGKKGHPIRTTISDMGPILLARLLELSDVQAGVLNIVFRIADDKKLLLLDLKDLRSMLQYVGDNAQDFTTQYGNVTKQSVGTILRSLMALEDAGGDSFFGEPKLDIHDWLGRDENGHGIVNILHCVELYQKPILYATFMLWLLNELFEVMPEVGDLDRPKIAFFFDEAHLLFSDAPKALVDKVVQVVKLIRSKGVGVYFITQNPADLPDPVLAQLGNRVQHALHGYTPAEQKAIKAASESFRPNKAFKTEEVIGELGIGEALTSFLDENGTPSIVMRTKILPPMSNMGAADDATREKVIKGSDVYGKYEQSIDRESAYEILTAQNQKDQADKAAQAQAAADAKAAAAQAKAEAAAAKEQAKAEAAAARAEAHRPKTFAEKMQDKMVNKAINTVENQAIHALTRGIFGLLKK
jgi:DNA helicase HerA-like ATPase